MNDDLNKRADIDVMAKRIRQARILACGGWSDVTEGGKVNPEQLRQLDTGVALRRHASHVRELTALRGTGRGLLLTPLSISGTAHATIPTPRKHKRLR